MRYAGGADWLESKKIFIHNDEDSVGVNSVATNVFKILSRQEAFLRELSSCVNVGKKPEESFSAVDMVKLSSSVGVS